LVYEGVKLENRSGSGCKNLVIEPVRIHLFSLDHKIFFDPVATCQPYTLLYLGLIQEFFLLPGKSRRRRQNLYFTGAALAKTATLSSKSLICPLQHLEYGLSPARF
jgi:hypothetical protein